MVDSLQHMFFGTNVSILFAITCFIEDLLPCFMELRRKNSTSTECIEEHQGEKTSSSGPSKIEWDLTNGSLSKLLELLDTRF